ncbi:MAG: hypothetical protein ABS79_02670, partial [Planctomycetes bacterium SCN 63-9]
IVLQANDEETAAEPPVRPFSPEMPDAPGRSTRLQFFGQIAQGGMGAILKGRDPDLGRDVAVKVLLGKHHERSDLICRFVEEAQIGGQLQHPGIVPVYELGTFPNGRPFFSMKLLKGQTLSHLLGERNRGTDLARFLAIFESVCQTVAYAHSRGVIHRDLKPSNVMVGSFGEVQVMDWGLAKVMKREGASPEVESQADPDSETVIQISRVREANDLSQAGSVIGTPAYMSPEQARGEIEDLDQRCDVFALGSILCQILTGEAAYTGASPFSIQAKAARGDLADAFARLAALLDTNGAAHPVSSVDPELVSLCKYCLAPDPEDRPADAGEVAARVTAYRAGVQERLQKAEIARAEETARAEEALKRARLERHRRQLTVALAASLFGLVLLVAGGWISRTHLRAARLEATERAVSVAMGEAHQHLGLAKAAPVGDLSKWHQAVDSARQARLLLDQGEPDPPLSARVDDLVNLVAREQAEAARRADELDRDREFVKRLNRIRDQEFERAEGWDLKRTDADFATAFREFGIDPDRLDPTRAGELLKERSDPLELAFFLDDWAQIRFDALKDPKTGRPLNDSWRRLVAAASAIDPDPWRNRVRTLAGIDDLDAARNLARNDAELEKQPARSLLLLAQVLIGQEDKTLAEAILKRAWRLRPDDFWINSQLARISSQEKDRLRFATAAAALRPGHDSRFPIEQGEGKKGKNPE